MAEQDPMQAPKTTVVSSDQAQPSYGRRILADGTAAIAVGGTVAGGFGVEVVKSFAGGDTAGRWWIFGGAIAGLAAILVGLWLREHASRRIRFCIIAVAATSGNADARVAYLERQAEQFARRTCTITLKTRIELPSGAHWSASLVDALADEVTASAAMCELILPAPGQVNLIPIMPQNMAFWFGARLGDTHARQIVAYSVRQADGHPSYFPATSLRLTEVPSAPLTMMSVDAFAGGDPSKVALAVDLEGRGQQFIEDVKLACRQYNISQLITVRAKSTPLPDDQGVCTGFVEQVCEVWRDASLTSQAYTGRRLIFLNGPTAISVALGARLATSNRGRWHALIHDADLNMWRPFPALKPTATGSQQQLETPTHLSPSSAAPASKTESRTSRPRAARPSLNRDDELQSIDVGDRVNHDKYGLGTVVGKDGSGPRTVATIDFGSSGTIRLMLIGSVPLSKV